MRWFKHLTDSHDDERLCLLLDKAGLEGYGFWWLTLELIAKVATNDEFTVNLPEKKLSMFYGCHLKACRNRLRTLAECGLIRMEQDGRMIKLSCPNLRKFRDEFSRKKEKEKERISGQTPDRLRTDSGQTPVQDTDTDTEKDIYVEQARRVFEFWKVAMEKPRAQFTSDRRSKIRARLREGYSEKDCIKAIENCSRSEYHRGKNDNNKEYVNIGLIFRNGDYLEKFRDMKPKEQWEDKIPEI